MTGEGTGDRVEAVALPAPSTCGRAKMIGDMGIIGRAATTARMSAEERGYGDHWQG